MAQTTNPCTNPRWSRGPASPDRTAPCSPPILEARIYRDEEANASGDTTSGDCLGTVFGLFAVCAACVFGVLRYPSDPGTSPDSSPVSDLAALFFKQYSDAAFSAQSQTGVPAAVLLTEAFLTTGGTFPKDHNLFGYGPAKTPFKSFLARATKCANALNETYTDLDEYMNAASKAKLYTKSGEKQVRANLSTFKKMFEN